MQGASHPRSVGAADLCLDVKHRQVSGHAQLSAGEHGGARMHPVPPVTPVQLTRIARRDAEECRGLLRLKEPNLAGLNAYREGEPKVKVAGSPAANVLDYEVDGERIGETWLPAKGNRDFDLTGWHLSSVYPANVDYGREPDEQPGASGQPDDAYQERWDADEHGKP